MEQSIRLHVEKPTEVPSSPSELRLPACGETAAKLISVGGRRLKRRPAAGGDVEHATIAAVVRGIDSKACGEYLFDERATCVQYRADETSLYFRNYQRIIAENLCRFSLPKQAS